MKIKIYLLTFVVVITSLFVVLKKPDNSNIITLTKNGFVPAGIKINPGDTIVFKARGVKTFWPASDLHPDHSIFPDFDPKKALMGTESWSFKFDTPGTYRFHDHINPANRGMIIVAEENSASLDFNKKITEDDFIICKLNQDIDEKRNCYSSLLLDLVIKKGPDTAFLMVDMLRQKDPDFAADCHTVAHSMGEVSYWDYAKRERLPSTGAVGYCGFGFLHGFMQEVGHHSKDFKVSAKGICDHFAGLDYSKYETTVNPEDQCYHGVGHGMAFYYIADYLGDISGLIKKGARDCNDISSDPQKVSNCIYGLFGGVSGSFAGNHGYTFPINKSDPLEFCRGQEDRLIEPCLDSMVPTLGVLFNNDFAKIMSFLNTFNEKYLKQPVFAVGDLSSKWIALGKMQKEEILNVCLKNSSNLKLRCFEGVSQGLVRNGGVGRLEEAIDFCVVGNLNNSQKDICIQGVLDEIKLIFPDEVNNLKTYAETKN